MAGDGDRRLPPAPGLPAAGNRAKVLLPARRHRPSGLCYRQERFAPGPGSLAAAHRGLPSLGIVPGGTPARLRENRANLRNFLTQDKAAGLFRVSRRPVTATAKILGRESRAIPELRRAVLSGLVTGSDAAAAVKEPAGAQRAAVDLALRRETRTVRQAVNMVKEELGLPEDIESDTAIPDTTAKVPPVFHQSAIAGLQGLVEPETVDAIVTFPSANAWSGSLLTDQASFAAHSLKRTGGMFVLAGTESLLEFIGCLRHPDLSWVCALHYVHHDRTAGSRRNPRGGAPGQKLLLVYGKPGFSRNGGDGVISALPHDEGTQ